MTNGVKRELTSILAMVAGLTMPTIVHSQTAAPATTAAPADGEIVVTAQKRSERLGDVPAAVSVLGGAELQANGQTNPRDLSGFVPGLQVGSALGSGNFVIRGISSGQDLNPTVATMIDGVPIGPISSGSVGALFIPELDPSILQRVEVLRGPQGTLYGAASLGGIVNYVTRDPSLRDVSGTLYVEGLATEHGAGSIRASGSLSLPIVKDKLALQVSVFDNDMGGYIEATQHNDNRFNYHRSLGGRVALLWQATPDLKFQLSHIYSRLHARNDEVTYDAATASPAAGDLKYNQVVYPDYDAKFNMTTLKGDYDFHGAILSYIGSYQTQNSYNALDYASGALTPLLGILPSIGGVPLPSNSNIGVPQWQTSNKNTHELRLASTGDTTLRWVGGLFYSSENSGFLENIGNYDENGVRSPAPLDALLIYNVLTHLTEAAAFGNVTYYVTPHFDLTGGLRYEQVRQNYRELFSGSDATSLNLLFGAFGYLPTPADTGTSKSKDNVVNYLFNARYHFSPSSMVYFRFATGYRAGGPNLVSPGIPNTYGPDKTDDYELGLKTGFWGRKGFLDITAFLVDWKNIQILTASEGLNGLTNGGSAQSKGFEASMTLEPVQRLRLAATGAYTDAKLGNDIAYAPLGLADGQGAKGDRLPSVPKWSGSLSGEYSWPWFSGWDGFAAGSVRYVGDRQSVFSHSVVYTPYLLPSYVMADIRGGLRKGPIELTAFIHNLNDSRAQIGVYTTGGTDTIIARPRSYGVSAAYRF